MWACGCALPIEVIFPLPWQHVICLCCLPPCQVLSPDAAALAVKDLLQCDDAEAQNHLKTFFEVMNTSSQHVTYTSGTQHGLGWCMEGVCMGWCMEELYGMQCVWREHVGGSSGVHMWYVGRGCASRDRLPCCCTQYHSIFCLRESLSRLALSGNARWPACIQPTGH